MREILRGSETSTNKHNSSDMPCYWRTLAFFISSLLSSLCVVWIKMGYSNLVLFGWESQNGILVALHLAACSIPFFGLQRCCCHDANSRPLYCCCLKTAGNVSQSNRYPARYVKKNSAGFLEWAVCYACQAITSTFNGISLILDPFIFALDQHLSLRWLWLCYTALWEWFFMLRARLGIVLRHSYGACHRGARWNKLMKFLPICTALEHLP